MAGMNGCKDVCGSYQEDMEIYQNSIKTVEAKWKNFDCQKTYYYDSKKASDCEFEKECDFKFIGMQEEKLRTLIDEYKKLCEGK